MALVSIIIPYYKKRGYIKHSIQSVLNQTFQDFEIILVYDDDDKDDLLFIEKNYSDNLKVKIIKNPKNLGAGTSRNIGINNSIGKMIAFLDADDYWMPQKLEKQLSFMKKNNYKFTFCNYQRKINKKVIEVISNKKQISYNDLLTDCEIGLSTVILERSIVVENLFPPLKTKEDFLAWLKITKRNIIAHNLPEILVNWNYSKNSLSGNFFQKIFDGYKIYSDYLNLGLFKSIYYLALLSFNSLKRKL